MVGIDGKVVAEPNDSNRVRTTVVMTDGKPVFGRGSKTAVAWGSAAGILTLGPSSTPVIISLAANSYLCTDANGNLIFKEL